MYDRIDSIAANLLASRIIQIYLHDGEPGGDGTDNAIGIVPLQVTGSANGSLVTFGVSPVRTLATYFSMWDAHKCIAWAEIPGAIPGQESEFSSFDFVIFPGN